MIITLSGRSGTGKTSLMRRLQNALPQVVVLNSVTTRPPRPKDLAGEYTYVTKDRFVEKQRKGCFAWSLQFSSEFYATSVKDLEVATAEDHMIFICCLTIEKVRVLRKILRRNHKEHLLKCFYLSSPSDDHVLRSRMRDRGDERSVIEMRLMEQELWDQDAAESSEAFTFIHDQNGPIEEKFEMLMLHIAPFIHHSSYPPV